MFRSFKIDGKPQVFEFIDALERVLLNGRPFKVQFGGLPTVIIVRGKKHDFRFARLPAGTRPGYVNIAGMRGEPPKECPQEIAHDRNVSTPVSNLQGPEQDSVSQDSTELTTTSTSGKFSKKPIKTIGFFFQKRENGRPTTQIVRFLFRQYIYRNNFVLSKKKKKTLNQSI